jgi:hypothetical protein
MRFEISERIATSVSCDKLLGSLEEQFRAIAVTTARHGNSITVESIEASFGSINRNDTTVVEVKSPDNGKYLLTASVHYRPSVAFWIILVITLFTYIFWLIPIAFYIFQKNTVREGIQQVFRRIKDEYEYTVGEPAKNDIPVAKPMASDSDNIELLEKLATLKDKGLISEDDYQRKKKELLGL